MCKLHDRLCKAKERLARLKTSHVDIDVKAQVISASVYPVAFHGSELFPVGQQHTRSLRYHVAEALVGPSESMASALVTMCASKYVRPYDSLCLCGSQTILICPGQQAAQSIF